MSIVLIGIGAGLVSALLFGVVTTGSPLAMLLSYVAPLPILIASLGWNHRCGLVAALSGGLATVVAFRLEAGLAFAIGSALPSWWVAYLALLGRTSPEGALEWYPVGRLLLWVAAAAALVTLAGVIALGDGDYEGYRKGLRQALDAVLRSGFSESSPPRPDAPGLMPPGPILETLLTALPLIASAVFALVFALNLWLAAKVVQVSGRLPRPWPFIPATAMPRQALLILIGAVALCLFPGFLGAAGLSLAGALLIAFALQGLAFLHEATRGRAGRTAMLSVAYVLILFVGHTVLPLLAILGIADTALALRRRLGLGGTRPRPPST